MKKTIVKILIKLLSSFLVARLIRKFFLVYWNNEAKKLNQLKQNHKPRLFWGTIPMLNNKYWSQAMKLQGYESTIVVKEYYNSINKKGDFDLFFDDIIKSHYKKTPNVLKYIYSQYFVMDYILKHFDIVHTCCEPMLDILTKKQELLLLNKSGIKSIVIPYGGDIYRYSKMLNISRRHTVQINYPGGAKKEKEIELNVDACVKYADIFIPCEVVDGIGRWDLLPCNLLTIDTKNIQPKSQYNQNNGKNGFVTIAHAPNHRGAKGTDFILNAIVALQAEGYKINLKLIENTQNDELLRILKDEVDIVVNEVVGTFYALFCVEGMATGVPVISNLSVEEYTRIFRRFSYLNECPVVSATIESIKDVLEQIIINPLLREELGKAGRKYVEKYHSENTAKYVFEKIYDKIWYKKPDVDLMNLFSPLNKKSYNNLSPIIEHPLKENNIPQQYIKPIKINN